MLNNRGNIIEEWDSVKVNLNPQTAIKSGLNKEFTKMIG